MTVCVQDEPKRALGVGLRVSYEYISRLKASICSSANHFRGTNACHVGGRDRLTVSFQLTQPLPIELT
jgi:hypothetical protein